MSEPRSTEPLRFGLVGTGFWARLVHAQALASTPGIELSAVWGRDEAAAGSLAAEHGATAYRDFDEFLAAVDAVAFSVPPHVQSPLAVRAASAGRHLLLEKPIATSLAQAQMLEDAARAAGVATVVFFTGRFQPGVRAWLTDVGEPGGWSGGSASWLGSALAEAGSPFDTPWRREKGGLWDVGPHAVSLLWASLGPVVAVTAVAGRADLSCLVLQHHSGATSTAVVTLSAPPAAAAVELQVWGERGRSAAPAQTGDPVAALRVALTELAGNARAGRQAHPCDVSFGCEVTRVLAAAQAQLDGARGRDAEAADLSS
jgi:predicted dehydrogenase